jgi:subfamily B ATP-binding cassette protein HlyB/CyaB
VLQENLQLSAESVAWGLRGMCELHRIPFAPELVLGQHPPPYTLDSLREVSTALGLKSAIRFVGPAALQGLPLPCLVMLGARAHRTEAATPTATAPGGGVGTRAVRAIRNASRWVPSPLRTEDGGVTSAPAHPAESYRQIPSSKVEDAPSAHAASIRLALLLRHDGQRVLLLEEGQPQPTIVNAAALHERFTGAALLFAPADRGGEVTDPDAPAHPKFGFRWFVPELAKHRTIWRDVLAASLAIQLMALATPLFTQVIIDKVVVHHTSNTLIVIAIALALFIGFTAAMSWVRQYLVLHTGNRIDAVLATKVFDHLLRLPHRYFEHRPTGTLVARLQGVETIRQFVTGAAVSLVLDVPFLLIFLAIMFWYSVPLTLVTLVILGAIVGLSLAITPQLRERLNRQFLLGARNQAFVTEYVSGMETVKSLQMEPQLSRRYGEFLAAYLEAGFRTRQLSNSYNVAANALEQLLTLLILCAGAWLVMTTQSMTIGMLVAFQMFAGRLSQPLLRIVGLWQEFQQADIAVKRLGDLMDAPAEPYAVIPRREGKAEGRLEVRNLSFRYAENLPWLYQGLDFAIEPGRCVALMGPSGSGKSTLAKLIQGFYQPADGAILVDGRDIRHLSANELRSHFGVVPQETVLFSGSIYDNLVIANPHAGFEQVVEACKLAEIHEVIEKLPEGYQTAIGEHGAGLSGGQKQRIAIARALLKRPRVLIFDEATSNLDQATAAQFAATLNRLQGGVGMLFVAHQLPPGLKVDREIQLGDLASRTVNG